MKKALALLLLLCAPAAWAADFRYLGTLNASAGASTNNAAAGCTKADGTTGAIGPFTASGTKPLHLAIQCDVAARLKSGKANTVAVANSGANKGLKLDLDQLFFFELTVGYLAVIPASGTGAAVCDLYQRVD